MDAPEGPPVFALGHSNQPFERFLRMLDAHGIRLVVDIRRFPRSKAVPWADGAELERLLAEHGIGYRHDPDLGGKRKPLPDSPNGAWRNDSFRGYADHMQTPVFRAALDRLVEQGSAQPTAILCAEAVPWRCHRGLVADALVARGVPVVQVLSPTKGEPHRLTSFARVRGGRVTYPGERPLDIG